MGSVAVAGTAGKGKWGDPDDGHAVVGPATTLRPVPDGPRDLVRRLLGDVVQTGWSWAIDVGTIRPGHRRAQRFARFGERSAICFPVSALFGESSIEIGDGCIIGPNSTLSAGVSPEQVLDGPVVTIGDRCVIGKGSGVVGHHRVQIGDDVWAGHYVCVSAANPGCANSVAP